MNPRFLERLGQDSNTVGKLPIHVKPSATLLFARHTEALLRKIAAMSEAVSVTGSIGLFTTAIRTQAKIV